mgnify:CR=1 FL=1
MCLLMVLLVSLLLSLTLLKVGKSGFGVTSVLVLLMP